MEKEVIEIIRKSDGERYILTPEGDYANKKSLAMGSIIRFPLEAFLKSHFTFIHKD